MQKLLIIGFVNTLGVGFWDKDFQVMENLIQELKDLYNAPSESEIKRVTERIKEAAKNKNKDCKIYYLSSCDCEYFRKLGFTVNSCWDKIEDCQVAVFSGWASDDT